LKDTVLPACSDADRKRIMAVIKFGTFLALLNETIINVALTKLTSVFAVSENTVQWLTSGYMLVLGILVPVTAFLIERLSTRELYLASMSIFLIGTVFAACSVSFPMLLCARLFQGLGAGVMMPLLMNTIMVLNPPEKRGAAMGSALLIVLFAPAVGPTFSGVVLQLLSWRWIFIIIIPLAAVSVVTGWLFLKNVTEKKRRGLDVFSLALSTVGFGGLLYGINELCSSSSGLSTGAAALAAGAAALVAFVVRQLKVPDPLLDVRVFRSPMFSLGMLLITLTYVIMFANYVLMPMFMQSVIGLSVFATGLAVLPGGIIGAVLPSIFGKVYDRRGPRVIVPLGFAVMAAAALLISRLGPSAAVVTAALCYCLVMLGIDTMLSACQTNSLNQLSKEYYAHGSAVMNTLMMIGSALGSSVFIALMAQRQRSAVSAGMSAVNAASGGISFSYLIAAALAAAGFAAALFFRKE
jgi:DHA2 family lincomycin resistance protein-like MFS transporter